MKILVTILFLFCAAIALGQGEANNWYFGQNAGITFNTSPPSALTNGRLNTLEGCTTISDPNGKLLFYTDGSTVYNRNHTVMQNGFELKGDESSTTSAIIIPQPGNNRFYYIFTVDEPHHFNADSDSETSDGDGSNDGLNYSVVDMTLDGGNGAVVSSQKNIPLITYNPSNAEESLYKCSEKITAVKSEDCNTFWIISHFKDTFYAFRISTTGITTTPVTSQTGITVPTSGYRRNALGYIKASPQGDKLAVAHFGLATEPGGNGPGKVLLYNFDNTTGQVRNETELYDGDSPYGIEFSQSGDRLYTTISRGDDGLEGSFLYQFDLTLPSDQIAANGKRIRNENNEDSFETNGGALQIGPDGKIYRAEFDINTVSGDYLGVIENPEAAADEVIYTQKGILLNTDRNRAGRIGLPPFIQSIFAKKIDIINNGDADTLLLELCEGDSYILQYDDIPGATYTWFFNNTAIANTNSFLEVNISGNYRLEVDQNNGDCPLIGAATVKVNALPDVTPTSLTQCDPDNDGFTIFNLTSAISDLIEDDTNTTIQFFETMSSAQTNTNAIANTENFQNTPSQLLFARVTNTRTGCYAITTLDLLVTSNTIPDIYLIACDDDGAEDGFYEFDLSQADAEILRTVSGNNVSITYHKTQEEALLKNNPINTYVNEIQGTQEEDVIFARTEEDNNSCYAVNQVVLTLNAPPSAEKESSIILCENSSITITSGILQAGGNIDQYEYLWSTGASSESIEIASPGSYEVLIIDKDTECETLRNIEVLLSKLAVIQNIAIEDARQSNRVRVVIENEGSYEYALETENTIGKFQESPVFTDVAPGSYRLIARNKDGCGEVKSELFSVIGFPNYFTPNGDNFHETWNIEGLSPDDSGNVFINIFDRSGRLLTQLQASGSGWDGTFNGQLMPSSEYWFQANLADGRTIRGSFSLIR